MPGSIQVSVLDIKELPSSSTSVKVSLGNVEYEAVEKGTFLFPLMNLRDNLILTVQDTNGNQVSHSGFRTMTIIEKGTWDDVFPVEGGGLVHMKLQFILSDEERNRIRLVRESAMKKKQAEILGSRLRNAGHVRSLASPLHRHENAADRSKETPLPRESEQKPNSSGNLVEESYKQNLEEKFPSDVKGASEQSTSTPLLQETKVDLNMNNEIPLQPAEEPKYPAKVVDNSVEKLDKQNLEEKIPVDDKQTSNLPPFSQGTEVITINNNEIKFQQPQLPKRLQDTSSHNVGSTSIAEKIKLFPPKLAGELDKQGSADKTTRKIKKMISVFESSLPQDTVPLQPSSTKSYRVGTLRSLKDSNFKDYYEKLESSQERLKNSETSSSTRLRNSFSTGDLRKNLSSIIKEGDEVGVDGNFVEKSEVNLQSEGNDPKGTRKLPKQVLNNEGKVVLTEINTKNSPKPPREGVNNEKKFTLTETKTKELPKSLEEDATVPGRVLSDNKESHTRDTEKKSIDGRKFEEKGHQEKIVASIPEVAKGEVQCESDGTVKQGEEMENSESACVKATNGSLGQAIKIALVVGFGVLVLLLRQREPGKGKKNENKHAIRNQVFMNKRGSIEEQHRIGVSRFS